MAAFFIGEKKMPEDTEVLDDTRTDTDNWVDEYPDLSDEDREMLGRYKTRDDAIKAIPNQRRQISQGLTVPDENTSEEDKAKFDAKIAAYHGVPDKPDGYELPMPEGVDRDEQLETFFRDTMHKHKGSKGLATALFDGWNALNAERKKVYDDAVKEAETQLRKEWRNDFDTKIGNPEKEVIGTIKKAGLALSKILKLDYKAEDGSLRSELTDCLDLDRKNGPLGDKVAILKVFDWVYENFFAEGKTFGGDPATGKGKGEDDLLEFHDMDDDDDDGRPQTEQEDFVL